ncbi:hypothetical protein JTE88_07925 [Arcanobacterium phocisimile]|uniref:Uncharacterized protein n=1 Tax=Arcanobacterium phocisimile TaxID=1302235 RepID=A0ABX7IGX1_9ACTO|nr:hypothetical protein [Arcanobacterium phocisimile]QRV01995.1 hypothetical protein JTE88_07925 [Arcanobacterium phocisimile]
MGFGGFGIAIVAVFLLIYLVPQALRVRQVLGDAQIDDRFAEDLRLIDECTFAVSPSPATHGKIFLTERIMTPLMTSEQLRRVARDRSRARARMATRHARQMRGMMIGLVLMLFTVGAWIAVGIASISSALAIGVTSVMGIYSAGLGFVVNEMLKADKEDSKRIGAASKILREHSRAGMSIPEAQPQVHSAVQIPDFNENQVSTVADDAAGEQTPLQAPVEISPVRKMTREEIEARTAALAVPAMPSYTLKSVVPHQPSEAQMVDVPFRPTRLHERVGDAPVAQAHAPVDEEQTSRDDVLGGGSMLDALLSRRRA